MSKTSHNGILPLVHSILAADTSPLGMTFEQVMEASGLGQRQCSAALQLLKRAGRCFSNGIHRFDRFFYASAERMEACRPAVDARLAEVSEARRAEERRKNAANARSKRAAARKAKEAPQPKEKAAPKQKPAKVAKPAKPANVQIRKPPKVKWSDAPVVVPDDVKVTVCPGCTPRSFAPPPEFKGPLVREWERRRGVEA
jgi:sRNA-binding protein